MRRQPRTAILKRTLLTVLYALLLMTAQQSALTHAAWHAGGEAPAHQDGKGTAPDNLCDLHHACAQVLGGVQGALPPCTVYTPTHVLTAAPSLPGGAARFLAPLCRGPPRYS